MVYVNALCYENYVACVGYCMIGKDCFCETGCLVETYLITPNCCFSLKNAVL